MEHLHWSIQIQKLTNQQVRLSSRVVISFVGLKTIENEISASGTATDNAKFTFLMEDAVILIDNDTYIGAIPPPPPAKVKNSNVPTATFSIKKR